MTWTEVSAASTITRNGGNIVGNHISCAQPGLKLLGAIDYLVSQHKYTWSKSSPGKHKSLED